MEDQRWFAKLLYLFVCITHALQANCAARKNVLFLVSDDMRPEIGAYHGPDFPSSVHPEMHTPNLDKLASKSLLLKRAYVQQAVCSPSRTSLLTGRRPDTTRVHDLMHYFRTVAGNFTTIPQYFKENGYVTAGMGKIFHPGRASGDNDPISWTEPYYFPRTDHWLEEQRHTWFAVDDKETEQFPLPDQLTAQRAFETLKRLAPKAKTGEQPIFVAVGFRKPHLPFVFPSRFMDFYPKESIRLPKNPFAPAYMPEVAWSDFAYLRTFVDIQDKYGYGTINTTLADDKVIDMRRAYYAAITYVDDLLGQVVQTMEDLGLSDNTIISFWGDHGWQLGEHGEWGKHTNFELATHAPMMVHVPGITDEGEVTEQLTEFVDLFPTLVEAAGLPPVPLCPETSHNITLCTEGTSFVPLMKHPEKPWKSAVFSQFPRMLISGDIIMGYSMRTDKYRYTAWVEYDNTVYKPFSWNPVAGCELYDHTKDPDENFNVEGLHEYAEVKRTLHEQLQDGWRAALPPN